MSEFNPEIVMWEWRDGSVHPEMKLVSFFIENELHTHLDGTRTRFRTACDLPWFGVTSSSGLGDPSRVDCENCRKLISGLRMVTGPQPVDPEGKVAS
jgi:hypothetical protein